jgi:hypothetical protein
MVLLDFKIKVPPHLSQNKNLTFSKDKDLPQNNTIDDAKVKEGVGQASMFQWFLLHFNLVNMICLLSLLPLIMDSLPINNIGNRQQLTGCLHLLISPITTPCIFFFNLHHKNSKRFTFVLAISSLFLGNIAGMVYCSKCVESGEVAFVCLSISLILGAFQLLMLINKKNIGIVMISTASTVVVCGLCISALFLPAAFSKRCYQSTIPCIVWLFWQAMRNQREKPPEKTNFKSDNSPLNVADTI